MGKDAKASRKVDPFQGFSLLFVLCCLMHHHDDDKISYNTATCVTPTAYSDSRYKKADDGGLTSPLATTTTDVAVQQIL